MRVSIGPISFITLLLMQPTLQAQDEAELPPAPPAGAAEPAAADSAPPADDAPPACVPACRSGFVCHAGQCVSACNPPCAPGEMCVAGECTLAEQPPPPSYPNEDTGFDWSDQAAPGSQPGAGAGVEEHDGFMLRLTLGFGAGSATEDLTASGFMIGGVSEMSLETTLSGVAGSFSLDLGGSVAENLVLHARLADMVIVNPTVEVNGVELGEAEDASLAFLLLAPAVTYYIMPVNIYLTLAVGVTWGQVDVEGSDNNDNTTDPGIGANFDLGKEWWVGDDWGLGVAGRLWFSHVSSEESSGDFSASADLNMLGGAVLFSATFQ